MTGRAFDETVLRHDFRDVLSTRLGASYARPVADSELELRAGIAHDTAAAPVSWTRLDLDGSARPLQQAWPFAAVRCESKLAPG